MRSRPLLRNMREQIMPYCNENENIYSLHATYPHAYAKRTPCYMYVASVSIVMQSSSQTLPFKELLPVGDQYIRMYSA